MAKKQIITVSVCVAVLAVASVLIARTMIGGTSAGQPWGKQWYYDIGASKIYVDSEALVPPVASPSGGEADGPVASVHAAVYACGSCDDESKRFAAWLAKFTPTAKARIQAIVDSHPKGPGQLNPFKARNVWGDPRGYLIADPATPTAWYDDMSAEAAAIKAKVGSKCGGAVPVACKPR